MVASGTHRRKEEREQERKKLAKLQRLCTRFQNLNWDQNADLSRCLLVGKRIQNPRTATCWQHFSNYFNLPQLFAFPMRQHSSNYLPCLQHSSNYLPCWQQFSNKTEFSQLFVGNIFQIIAFLATFQLFALFATFFQLFALLATVFQ